MMTMNSRDKHFPCSLRAPFRNSVKISGFLLLMAASYLLADCSISKSKTVVLKKHWLPTLRQVFVSTRMHDDDEMDAAYYRRRLVCRCEVVIGVGKKRSDLIKR
jgi:hypothetical protein